MQKILINDISFIERSNRVPIISKIRYWQSKGKTISIITTSLGAKVYQSQLAGIEVLMIPTFGLTKNRIQLIFEYMLRNGWVLLKLSSRIKSYDWIYSISAVADNLVIPFVLKLLGRRFRWSVVLDNIVTFEKEQNSHIRFLAFVFFKLSLIFVKKADVVFVISKDLGKFLINNGVSKNRILVTGNAVESELIRKAKHPEKHNYDAIYVGRINEVKGAYDLLDLVHILTVKYPKFTLAIAGAYDAGVKNQFLQEIAKLNLSNNIILKGYVAGLEKFELIKSSKVFISLSHYESFGVAVLEAVCCDIPTVVYALPVYGELYKSNEVQMVPYKDIKLVAAVVTEILESPEKFTVGKETKDGWLNKFSWEMFAQQEWDKINEV